MLITVMTIEVAFRTKFLVTLVAGIVLLHVCVGGHVLFEAASQIEFLAADSAAILAFFSVWHFLCVLRVRLI